MLIPGKSTSSVQISEEIIGSDHQKNEVLSPERMEALARSMAQELQVHEKKFAGSSLLPEVMSDSDELLKAYLLLTNELNATNFTPASEWFLDNFHIIEDQLRSIKRDLPKDFYDELPKIKSGQHSGMPRVYVIAQVVVEQGDARIDLETLKRFIRAYQTISPLTIGELWAVAITLRISLIKRLLPLVRRILLFREQRHRADVLADEILALAVRNDVTPDHIKQMLEASLSLKENFQRPFIVHLMGRLRDQDPGVFKALEWLEEKLHGLHSSTALLIQWEHYRQAADQVSIGNIITSMRLFSVIDWHDFFESVSLVDPILSEDPVGVFASMDIPSRDCYRKEVERLARGSGKSEIEVAQKALSLAQTAEKHIGFFLLDDEVLQTEKAISYSSPLKLKLARFVDHHPSMLYFGSMFSLMVIFSFTLLRYHEQFNHNLLSNVLVAVLILIPVSELSLGLVNYFTTLLRKPKRLPRMDYKDGVPLESASMVVVPCMFTSSEVIAELVNNLEVQYLANQDDNISFSLLGDLRDADQEILDQDAELIKFAHAEINELNERYAKNRPPRFFVFHRYRKFNTSEGKWMGWERKRGKILEFNRLMRGAEDTSYISQTWDVDFFKNIKYIVTLDADTQLPLQNAKRLIGTITHPLNRPVYCPKEKRIIKGYGIIQPRISVSVVSAARTRFSQIFSGNTGIDPYTTAVSDVYQDLFGEGTYTGKGLYEIDAFEKVMEERVPENCVLSHDLFEGSFTRVALVTDYELIDDYPSDFETFRKRNHRWTRGDWQILPWLFPVVKNAHGKLVKNNLPLVARWKIFDNLRRSMLAPIILAWMWLSWTILPGSALVWTAAVLLTMSLPVWAPMFQELVKRKNVPWPEHIKTYLRGCRLRIEQIFLMVVYLPSIAHTNVDAVLRSLFRMLVSHKHMLEWVTFSQTQKQVRNEFEFKDIFTDSTIFAAFTLFTVCYFSPESLLVALPFIATWAAAPYITHQTRKIIPSSLDTLNADEVQQFRRYARMTWHFFETFAGEKENWLAPDNFQEDPKPVVAHRTSPTNIGLQLLANLSALDLGYIGVTEFIERTEKTFASIDKLEKYQGHLYNWYDTQTLAPLHPKYISTVDSGNFAGHLITLKQACLEIAKGDYKNKNFLQGLGDTFGVLDELLYKLQHHTKLPKSGSLKRLNETLSFVKSKSQDGSWDEVYTSLQHSKKLLNDLIFESRPELFDKIELWMDCLAHQVDSYRRDESMMPNRLRLRLKTIAYQAHDLAHSMDFKFLFCEQRKVFAIGYNASDLRRDDSFYDLLASESRLTSFFAISKGDVSEEHWFRLGRGLTNVVGSRCLVSWSATMFEYLMPLLVMKRYGETLLDQTYDSVVKRQIEYGEQRQIPWGVSEAGFNARDLQYNYQYGPFGIPGLGLKRGLRDELVISPYSTMLAAMVHPRAALKNLNDLEKIDAFGDFGFYESIDYTPERVPKNKKSVILHSYMAHHQGMSLLSINNLLNNFVMQERFHNDPRNQAVQLLLQERIPASAEIAKPRAEETHVESFARLSENHQARIYVDPHLSTPRTQILSNGSYSVMVTTSGSGFSKNSDRMVTRWKEDATLDNYGQFIFFKNMETEKSWSTSTRARESKPLKFEALFSEDRVELVREDQDMLTSTEIIVSSEDNAELRRVTLTNKSFQDVVIEVTSFMEVTLAGAQDDAAHPAFSNLFIQTEFLDQEQTLLAMRRPRSQKEKEHWGFHTLTVEGKTVGPVAYETDRFRFVGRGNSVFESQAITTDSPLTSSVGAVLDPIFSLRQKVIVPAKGIARLTFSTGVGTNREECINLANKYRDQSIFPRELSLGWVKSQVGLRHLNISAEKAHIFQRLGGRILYLAPYLRGSAQSLASNKRQQSALWAYGISGDTPVVLTRIHQDKDMGLIRELLRAHEYLRLKGIRFDLVILNEHATSYLQTLQDEVMRQILISGSHHLLDKNGGIFVRRADLIPAEDLTLLKTIARVNIFADKGTLEEQLKRRPVDAPQTPPFVATVTKRTFAAKKMTPPKLTFDNGFGGFVDDGKEYVIHLEEGKNTPAPWINVIANSKDFGFIISESGAGYTWSVNSRENRITPWSNDPVSDPAGEAIYLRDDETGVLWSPTPRPIRSESDYLIRHGQGYSEFESEIEGFKHNLTVYVPMDATVKIYSLKIKNVSSKPRKISVTPYVEWVLGVSRAQTSSTVYPEWNEPAQAILARNSYNNEFAGRTAFMGMSEKVSSFTCDRREFLGRNGNQKRPEALTRESLSNKHSGVMDPCGAMTSSLEFSNGEEKEIIIILGQAGNEAEALELLQTYRLPKKAAHVLEDVKSFWDKTLTTITVKTPDESVNIMMNRWLVYQTLVCRYWARSAFYQSGGAFGFRDQLQDVMALVYTRPDLTREQIINAAHRQFPEGDVQHWWHPPTGRGVRTRFSDDLLWLPFVTAFYLDATNDYSILDVVIPFIDTPLLTEGHDETYTEPRVSDQKASLLEHCLRTMDRSLKVGSHGLPLFGSGDWNDGMSRVGHEGRGESVWMAWFLSLTLKNFIPVCEKKNESSRAELYKKHLVDLKTNIEKNAWDGEWYLRAFFDNGEPMGSRGNEECKIDAIAQSWAVLSGQGDPARAKTAMRSVDENLILRNEGLIKLFTPPFDKSSQDPGYIKGYVPGVRENGGQYTHAAIWTMMAYAEMGNAETASELFNMINPINHAKNFEEAKKYKVEPYVVAADIYGLEPHIGRGGWSWYTGSASWFYRAGLEGLLGLKLKGDHLTLTPCIPKEWKKAEVIYRRQKTEYHIIIKADEKNMLEFDGKEIRDGRIPLLDDGKTHKIILKFTSAV
jgi:cyclic beta-1,2-glucan synthetase